MSKPASTPATPLPLLSRLDITLMDDMIIDFCKVFCQNHSFTGDSCLGPSCQRWLQQPSAWWLCLRDAVQKKERPPVKVDLSIPSPVNHQHRCDVRRIPHLDPCFSLEEINSRTGWHRPRPSWKHTFGRHQLYNCCELSLRCTVN